MTEVVNVRFRNKGKVYFFDPAGVKVLAGQSVIVETAKGIEIGDCTCGNHEVDDSRVVQPLRPVIRVATDEDKATAEQNAKKEAAAFDIFQQKIKEHGLDMKLVDVEYNFEGSKIIFFFTSDGRVDFRELVKDLASVFRTRIELRQIGVRDEAKMLGGLGICGRPFCCSAFLEEFQPVSIKMAKTQSLSLNPTKISGTCGRLMCCLKYEQDAYEYLVKNMPKVQSEVETPLGKGVITDTNLLRQTVKVRLADQGDDTPKTFKVTDLGEGAQRRYEEEKKQEAEALSELTENIPEELPAVEFFSGTPAEEEPREKSEGARRRRRRSRNGKIAEPHEKQGKPAEPEKSPDVKQEKGEKQNGSRKPRYRGRDKTNNAHGNEDAQKEKPESEPKQTDDAQKGAQTAQYRRRPRRRGRGGSKGAQGGEAKEN